jgi:dihydrolipoyl dehydrogenase
MKQYEVAIIGAGTAGLSARKEVAKVTDQYVVIEGGPLGTTCARVGCMPSKIFIQVANDYYRRLKFKKMGILGAEKLRIDTRAVMKHLRRLRDRFVKGVLEDMEGWQKDHLIKERAQFSDLDTLDVGGEKIKAKKIIIATGSKPVVPPAWEKFSAHFIDSDQLFELKQLPQKIAVIGLGPVGIEIGQAFSRLGVKVVGIDIQRSVGGISDPLILDEAIKAFSEEFPLFFEKVEIVGEGKRGLMVKLGKRKWEFEKLFLAMGRRPALQGLGLDKLNIKLDQHKIPLFQGGTYQIKGTSLYLAGDVNGERPLLHEAMDEGRIAGFNAVRDEQECFLRRTSLVIVFTDPNICTVGKNYQGLIKEKTDFVIGQVSYQGQGRAVIQLKEKGMLRIYGDKKSGEILGAEIFAPEGEHLAHLLAWVISLKLNVFEVLELPYYHPVLEEGLRSALRDLAKKVDLQAPKFEILRCQDPPAGTQLK